MLRHQVPQASRYATPSSTPSSSSNHEMSHQLLTNRLNSLIKNSKDKDKDEVSSAIKRVSSSPNLKESGVNSKQQSPSLEVKALIDLDHLLKVSPTNSSSNSQLDASKTNDLSTSFINLKESSVNSKQESPSLAVKALIDPNVDLSKSTSISKEELKSISETIRRDQLNKKTYLNYKKECEDLKNRIDSLNNLNYKKDQKNFREILKEALTIGNKVMLLSYNDNVFCLHKNHESNELRCDVLYSNDNYTSNNKVNIPPRDLIESIVDKNVTHSSLPNTTKKKWPSFSFGKKIQSGRVIKNEDDTVKDKEKELFNIKLTVHYYDNGNTDGNKYSITSQEVTELAKKVNQDMSGVVEEVNNNEQGTAEVSSSISLSKRDILPVSLTLNK